MTNFNKILVEEWIYFIRTSPSPYQWKNSLLDLIQLEYDWRTPEEQDRLTAYGTGPYWVSTPRYLASPLPDWAIAAVFAGKHLGYRRFPRFLFGHERYQNLRANLDSRYQHISVRAVLEFLSKSLEEQREIEALVRQYRAPFVHIFSPEDLNFNITG